MLLLIAAATRLLAGCAWEMPGANPNRTGETRFDHAITVGNVGSLQQAFHAQVVGAVTAPIASNDGLFTTSPPAPNGAAYGLDPDTGAQRWTTVFPSGGAPAFFMGDAFAEPRDHRVLVGYGYPNIGGHYWASYLDAATGATSAAPVGTVVGAARFPDYAGVVTAFGSGGPVGIFLNTTFGSTAMFIAPGCPCPTSTDPTLGNGVVFVGLGNEERAYDAPISCNTPACPTKWTSTLDGHASDAVISSDGTTIYVGTDSGTVYALDASTGAVRWSKSSSASITVSPALSNGVLYVGTSTGTLAALSAADGTEQWSASTTSGGVSVQPATNGAVVFTGSSDGTLDAFAASGCGKPTCHSLWTHDVGGSLDGGLALAFGRLYAGGTSGLFAFAVPK